MSLWHPAANRLGVALLTASALACGGSTPDSAARPDYRQVAERLSAFIEHEMADKELPALSVVLVDDQETVWAAGFGWENPADSVPATAETVYRVGSVSKLFTDLAIMQAVERGDIDLDQPVAELLPGFAPESDFDKPITLRQLMSHRSGLVREPPTGHYFDDTAPSLDATVASLNSTRAVYEPEARTKYSNAGIATVGYVLEHMSGEPFAEYLDAAVLEPLGMDNSSFLPEPNVVDRLATAYMWTYDGRTFEAPTFQLGMAPAGSMYAPVTDLGLFMQAIFAEGRGQRGVVVTPSTLQAMLQPQFAEPGATTGYGIGFRLSEFRGQRAIGHGGAIYGFATDLAALPDAKLGAAAVTSMDVANTVVSRITRYALELMLAAREGRQLPEAEITHEIPEGLAGSVAGRYGSGDERLEITVRGGVTRLRLASSGVRLRLRAIGDTLVVDGRLSYGMRILPAPEGVLVNGRLMRRAPNPLPDPSPARWKGLIGEYGWDHNTLYVLEHEGRLHALIEWFFQYPLEELSPDVFAFPDWGLYHGERMVFRRDGAGKAIEVEAASVVFRRRTVGTEEGTTFTIDPVRPVEELRAEALAANPPSEEGDFLEPDLLELGTLDATIHYDIRYATTNNFMQSVFYDEARAFLQRPAAEALVRAHRKLKTAGYGLLIHDAYRPWYVTKMFWDATPADKKIFVANPATGSRHNRGAAVDLTLYDLATGEPVPMVGGYDEMSGRSYPEYPGGTSRQRWHRELLRGAMEPEGFEVYEFEWWHFDYGNWARYAIQNLTFDRIR